MPSCTVGKKVSSYLQTRKKKRKQQAVGYLTRISSASDDSVFETSASGISSSSSSSSSSNSSSSRSRSEKSRSSISSDNSNNSNSWAKLPSDFLQQRKERLDLPFEFKWARDDQLSTILEESRKNSVVSSYQINTPTHLGLPPPPPPPPPPPRQRPQKPHPPPQHKLKKANPNILRKPVPQRLERNLQPPSNSRREKLPVLKQFSMSERRSSSVSPKPIRPPPRDLDAISRIDASLVFEHFTTSDAWDLGSTLRERLLPIPTPVVINISLANQNQTIFHSVTHSGVMPDNESWVERKRRTVLRWGCSTWFMACKFGGDEKAFRERYALGNKAGDYAIHGGGVPIRVTGVEGVVAVVVVSGLKEDEDHAVIVEVIKELYY